MPISEGEVRDPSFRDRCLHEVEVYCRGVLAGEGITRNAVGDQDASRRVGRPELANSGLNKILHDPLRKPRCAQDLDAGCDLPLRGIVEHDHMLRLVLHEGR